MRSTTAQQVDALYAHVYENIDGEREAFRAGFMTALPWMREGVEGIREELRDAFDIDVELARRHFP
jgi:hypothetical protein